MIAFHCIMIFLATIFAGLVISATSDEWPWKRKHGGASGFAIRIGILICTPLVVYSSVITYSNIKMAEELLEKDSICYIPATISYSNVVEKIGYNGGRPISLTLNDPYSLSGIGNTWLLLKEEGIDVNLVGYREGKALIALKDGKTVVINADFIKIKDNSPPDDSCGARKEEFYGR